MHVFKNLYLIYTTRNITVNIKIYNTTIIHCYIMPNGVNAKILIKLNKLL